MATNKKIHADDLNQADFSNAGGDQTGGIKTKTDATSSVGIALVAVTTAASTDLNAHVNANPAHAASAISATGSSNVQAELDERVKKQATYVGTPISWKTATSSVPESGAFLFQNPTYGDWPDFPAKGYGGTFGAIKQSFGGGQYDFELAAPYFAGKTRLFFRAGTTATLTEANWSEAASAPTLLAGSYASGNYAIQHSDGRIEQHIRVTSLGVTAFGGVGSQNISFLVAFTTIASIDGFVNSSGIDGDGLIRICEFTATGAKLNYNLISGPFVANVVITGI